MRMFGQVVRSAILLTLGHEGMSMIHWIQIAPQSVSESILSLPGMGLWRFAANSRADWFEVFHNRH